MAVLADPAPDDLGRPGVGRTRGRISKDGQQLSLAIGVAANDPTSAAVLATATVLALDPVTLYRDALNDNRVARLPPA
ncbi:hypothetical protein MAHJHV47_46380 [Mycobacterium avium subsp. hominissuis]